MKQLYILAIVVLLGLTGCEKFLDEKPKSDITDANFFNTAADFNQAALGLYNILQNRFYQESCWGMMELVSDNTYTNAVAGSAGDIWYQVEEFRVLPDNRHVASQWSTSYQAIGAANILLDKAAANTTLDAGVKSPFEGEAHFMRAYMYFNLVRLYGAVPLILRPQSPLESFKITRAPVASVYDQIISDLKVAEQKLPDSYTGANVGRVTLWAAKALLGKVYLTVGNHTDAASKLREVVSSGKHILLPAFADVFRANNANNRESIFEIQFRAGQGIDREGSPFVDGMAPSTYRINLMYSIGTSSMGQGNGVVTTDLFNAYSAQDRRRDASIGLVGTGSAAVYFQRKFSTPSTVFLDAEDNFIVLRYADVLLMLAEALNESGYGSQEAFSAINAVRTRAGLSELNATNTPNKESFRQAVLNERRLELAFENHRWFDLLRFNAALPVLTAKGYPIKPVNLLFPVPQRERDLAPEGLPQNPGY